MYSYSVQQSFNPDVWVTMWPYACNQHCTNYREAEQRYDEFLHETPNGSFRLVRYKTITRGFICKTIVGVHGAPNIILCNKSI